MRLTLCAVAGLSCIAATELFVGRSDLAERLVPRGDLGLVPALESRVIAPHPHPAVVIFGTSRARGAFLPTVMERRLGLPRGGVLSLALGGDNISDAALLYRRNRDRLRGTRVVVLQLDPFQFNAGRGPSARFRRHAALHERLASYRGAARLGLLGDWVFRTGVTLPTLGYWTRSRLADQRPPPVRLDPFGRPALVRIAADHRPDQFTPARFRYWLAWQYDDLEYSPGLEQSALALIDTLHADGARVYLAQLPTAAGYRRLLDGWPGDPAGAFRPLGRALASRADGVGAWTAPEDAGLTEADLRDWGHLNTAGAIRWSDRFAAWLAEREPGLGRGGAS